MSAESFTLGEIAGALVAAPAAPYLLARAANAARSLGEDELAQSLDAARRGLVAPEPLALEFHAWAVKVARRREAEQRAAAGLALVLAGGAGWLLGRRR